MDLTQIKDITVIASPLIKLVVDEFITPKFKQLMKEKKVSIKMTSHSFENQFNSYLLESYKKYSIPNILVLGNQQKQLKDIYVPLEVVSESDENEKHFINDFNVDFIPKHKKVLVIDTAGMGKSTISKKIFLSVIEQGIGVPVLIELRRLSKEKRMIDEIFRQLSMINEKTNEDFVLELINKGGFIFMLDGFDEIEHDDRKTVVEDIRNFIDKAGDNYYLLTSRPEDALGAYGDFMSFNIRPLYENEAYLLLKKYDDEGEVSSLLIKKLDEAENKGIQEFLGNPLLVSLLYAAFEHKQTIPLKKYLFYRQVYDAFFERHDLTKGDSFIRTKYSKLESDDFHRVLRFIGYQSMRIEQIEFNKDELIKLIDNAKIFCVNLKFSSSDFVKDILTKVPLFIADGLYIRWAHKSIQEYFAASFIYIDLKSKQEIVLVTLSKDLNYRYINVLDLYYSMDYKSYRRFVIYELLVSYFSFLNEARQVWPNIEEWVASELFVEKLVFMKYIPSESTGDEDFDGLQVIANDDKHSWGVFSVFSKMGAAVSNTRVFSLRKDYSALVAFLAVKNINFIEKLDLRPIKSDGNHDFTPKSDYAYLELKENEPQLIDGINSSEKMKDVDINNLLASFLFYRTIINERKALEEFNSIKNEIEQESLGSLLLDGL